MELQILHWFESLHNPITDPVMYAITCLGNAGIFWILLCAAFLFIPVFKKDRKLGLSMAIGLILSLIMCNGIMKNLSARIRPFNADPTFENLYGMVFSIRTYISFFCSGISYYIVGQKERNSRSYTCSSDCSFKIISYSSLSDRCTCESVTWITVGSNRLFCYKAYYEKIRESKKGVFGRRTL